MDLNTFEKFGMAEDNAHAPDIIINKSLAMEVNLMKTFKFFDSNPRDLNNSTHSGFIL